MPIESLAARISVPVPDLPPRWLPLIHLYDPDLPLFPTHYVHVADPDPVRPAAVERVFGYIERVNVPLAGDASVTVVCNKTEDQLGDERAARLRSEVRQRLGLASPVVKQDVENAFAGPLAAANPFLVELWERVIANHYGAILPFGRLWDEVLGLARWVASWNSPSGRKGELIQAHYFASRFGEPIQSAGGVPQVDFFLLPATKELLDAANPLGLFPRFQKLLALAVEFQAKFCVLRPVAGTSLSAFTNPGGGKLNTQKLFQLFGQLAPALIQTATECFNAFDKGPQRTVIFLMMLADIRTGRLAPGGLTSAQFGDIQKGLKKTYQSPKAIQIYAQQSWGNAAAMPIDTWVDGFFRLPLHAPRIGRQRQNTNWRAVFNSSASLGKIERLLWIAGQARKVHSSACDDALWCLKFASTGVVREPNPLACTICNPTVLAACPGHASIRQATVRFNSTVPPNATFEVRTSSNNNSSPGQRFISCTGNGATDDFSAKDEPDGYQTYPQPLHGGNPITVAEFVQLYRR